MGRSDHSRECPKATLARTGGGSGTTRRLRVLELVNPADRDSALRMVR